MLNWLSLSILFRTPPASGPRPSVWNQREQFAGQLAISGNWPDPPGISQCCSEGGTARSSHMQFLMPTIILMFNVFQPPESLLNTIPLKVNNRTNSLLNSQIYKYFHFRGISEPLLCMAIIVILRRSSLQITAIASLIFLLQLLMQTRPGMSLLANYWDYWSNLFLICLSCSPETACNHRIRHHVK